MKYIGLLMFLFIGSTASACSLSPESDRMQDIETNIAKAQYSTVFVGEVSEIHNRGQFEGLEYVVEVIGVVRGSVGSSHNFTTPGHSCGSLYEQGEVVVWFLGTDLNSIDETTPQYSFDSVEEALAAVGLPVIEPANTLIHPTCKVWFDGCNICSRDIPGAAMACTKKACQQQEDAFCKNHFSVADGLPYVNGPTTQPNENFVGPTTPPPSAKQETERYEPTHNGGTLLEALWRWIVSGFQWFAHLFVF